MISVLQAFHLDSPQGYLKTTFHCFFQQLSKTFKPTWYACKVHPLDGVACMRTTAAVKSGCSPPFEELLSFDWLCSMSLAVSDTAAAGGAACSTPRAAFCKSGPPAPDEDLVDARVSSSLGKKNKCTWITNRHRGHTHACNQESVSLPLESVSSDSDSEPSSPVARTMANICKAKNGNMDLEWVSWQWCRCFWFQRIADDGVAWVIQNNAGYIQHMLNACAVISDARRSQKLSKELSHTWERVHQSHRNFRMQFCPNTLMQMTTSCMWRNILSPCGKTLINKHACQKKPCMHD